VDDLPEDIYIFKTLFALFDGRYQEMEWFYENRTLADITLMVCVKNKLIEESFEKK